ncbi:zinc-ribbon domain-containing protein [Fusibacillus kribbianus]|uniref:Zinc ribbon domain-containing protein n=1 Tax=Fusibacillus kribbianus TaxID=3044208 RepID=A0AAP4BCE7_9FIRM|nr:zinc-ribbon domain-containing protein [Ruminococcus sp. YH-rum2234]MDI9242977.1 zinc ribbon domain-containing protein [Ruminococcus sp. YH-rum2234]
MSKTCKNCGAQLPDEASFCPHCTGNQTEKTVVKPPRLWRKKAVTAALCLVLIAGLILAFVLTHRSKTYEGGAYLTYTDKDGEYELLAAFHPRDIEANRPVGEKSVSLSTDEASNMTVMLGVYHNGEIADPDEFFAKVESCTLEASPNENEALILSEPTYNTNFLPAARESDITYTGASGTNELCWTLHMKNGDTIRLRQTFEVIPLVHQVYTPEDTKLDTLEDLNALLARINEEVPEDTIVDIYLPPVTYTGNLTILSRAVNLYGNTEDSGRTVFAGSLSVNTHYPSNVMLFNLDFEGNGGIGLSATASVYMGGCSFTGWDIGAVALDGGMIGVERCVFKYNGIGFKYDSSVYSSFNSVFPDCTIADNDIGVQFARLQGTITIDFLNSVFSGNRIDIDNQAGYPIDTSTAVFQ